MARALGQQLVDNYYYLWTTTDGRLLWDTYLWTTTDRSHPRDNYITPDNYNLFTQPDITL